MKEVFLNDEEKAYKNAKIYRSFIYNKTKFRTNSKDEQFNSFIQALNIKDRLKRIEFIYDYCCNKIDKFYEGKNVCGFKNNKCINQQGPNCKYINGCCRLCPHQTIKGCSSSNLSCKLFFCSSVTDKYEVIKFDDLKILRLFTIRQRLMVKDSFFISRDQIILCLYIGSLLIYSIILFLLTNWGLIKAIRINRALKK